MSFFTKALAVLSVINVDYDPQKREIVVSVVIFGVFKTSISISLADIWESVFKRNGVDADKARVMAESAVGIMNNDDCVA